MPEPKQTQGRPRKHPGQGLDQFSIRLSKRQKYGLELLARERGCSLSDAVAYAVAKTLPTERVGTAATLQQILDFALPWDLFKDGEPSPDVLETNFSMMVGQLAPELGTPKQRYFGNVIDTLYSFGKPKDENNRLNLTDVYRQSSTDFDDGLPIEVSARRWYRKLTPWSEVLEVEQREKDKKKSWFDNLRRWINGV
jgi:hypothetical protein